MNSKSLQMMDSVLTELGLCRKQITREESVFRAVSEKLFGSQCHYDRVKLRCIEYLNRHYKQFQQYITESLSERIMALSDRKISPGHLEMLALSCFYKLDFIIFDSVTKQQYSLTENQYNKKICLCYVEDNHYDLIYTKETMQAAAVCQSVVYELLYKGVFGLDSELEEATLFLEVQKLLPKENTFPSCFLDNVISSLGPEKVDTLQKLCGRSSPPVPYRVAKALHPGLYRNVELDIVQEQKREARHLNLDITKGLSPGDKCQVVFDEGDGLPYQAHIQSLDNPQGTVLVYIEKLGVKRTVPARCVRPLPLNIYGEQLPVTQVNVLPYLKKNRRKKHPTIPVLFEDAPCSSFTSQSTSSSDSIDRHSGVHHSDVRHTAPSNRLDSSSSNLHSTHKSFQPIVVAPSQSSPVSTVVSPAALTPIPHSPGVYAYPGAVSAGPHAVLDERTLFCGASLDHSAGLPVTCIPQTADSGYCLVPSDPSQSYCVMSTGSAPQQGPVYWMPAMVAVPYGANVGQVNMGWTPTYNRDIAPAGLEYYQMTSQGQPEMTSGTMIMDNYSMPPPAPAVTLCSETGFVGGYGELPAVSDVHVTKDSSCSQTETGSSRRCYDNTAHKHNDKPDSYPGVKMNGVSEGQFKVCQKSGHVGDTCDEEESKGKDSEDGSEGMDVGSDGDSGCPSECADLSPVSGPDLFSSSELTHPDSAESAAELTATEKPRGKRRYYMYGNHKLVKPIKEIPLRFQILLAETSAAKARCEGQPIYMQPLSPGQHDLVYYQTNDSSQTQLNANASCFIPNQDGGGLDSTTQTAYLPECFTGVSSSFSSPCTNPSNFTHTVQHTPMFLSPLPPSSAPTSTQNCSTIIVYSSHSTSASSPPNPPPIRTITVPPPPFPPPSNMPPPPLEHPVCLTSSANQNICLIPSNQNPVKSEQQFKPPSFPAPPAKSLGMLSVPPPNVQHPCNASPHSMTPSSIAPSQMASNSIAPSPMTSCNMAASSGIVSSYANPTYISVQPSATVHPMSGPVMQSQPPPYSSMGGPVLQAPPSNYSPMVSSNQYMYIYPSPPTGQPASPHHLVYMVNPPAPTYQQQGVLVPLNCPVPVQ